MKILITGAAGFIGSAVFRLVFSSTSHEIVVVDNLSYSAVFRDFVDPTFSPRVSFERCDIRDATAVEAVFERHNVDAVLHLAAESHVDRSIDGPREFIETNIVGTFNLLQASLRHWRSMPASRRDGFRFQHISTDEVFGSLGDEGYFHETTPYDPSSPYSASKAASDHLVRAWHRTFGLPVVITNCSNNYGPYQFPEKLVPLMILNAVEGLPLPVYGDGQNVRDWLFVEDHAEALLLCLTKGRVGESYNIGGSAERRNLEVVNTICDMVDEQLNRPHGSARKLIKRVADRPGHDRRYAIDFSKIESELGWRPRVTFTDGIRETVKWYISNPQWLANLRNDARQRLGLAGAESPSERP